MDKHFWHQYYKERKDILSEEVDEFLIEELSKLRPATVLDVGSGSGHNSLWMAKQGWQVYALDYAKSASEIIASTAQALSLDNITAVNADITEYAPTVRFDQVCIAYMHLPADTRIAMIKNIATFIKSTANILYIGILKKEGVDNDAFNDLCTTPDVLHHELESIFGSIEGIRSETLHRQIPIDEGEYFSGMVFVFHARVNKPIPTT